MTERGSVHVERATTCPFVAFDDDRDERSDLPDHRHRCYAETPPAPRALAHQEAYCLSAGFPACPVFQDWAKREAARASHESAGQGASSRATDGDRPAAGAGMAAAGGPEPAAENDDDRARSPADGDVAALGVGAGTAAGMAVAASGAADDDADADAEEDAPPSRDPRVREVDRWEDDPLSRPRQVHRDWAEPPPWASSAAASGAGSWARSSDPDDPGAERSRPPEGAGLAASRWLVDGPTGNRSGDDQPPPGDPSTADPARTPAFLSTRQDPGGRPVVGSGDEDREAPAARPELAGLAGRPRSGAAGRLDPARRPQAGGRPGDTGPGRVLGQARPAKRADRDDGTPSWERPRRFEAYPTLKTRVGMPSMPPMILAVAALVVAALLLFFVVPGLFVGGGQVAQTSASPTASASSSTAPTPTPAPTAQTYTVKAGDTLISIARRYGLTQNQLLKANPQIKDPNKIAVGDVLTIPTKTSGGGGVITSAPSASPSDSSAP